MDKEKVILEQSTAIRTSVLPEVRKVIEIVKPDFDGVKPYKTAIVDWLRPIIDLRGFSVYPTNGITEGLNWWYKSESRSVVCNQYDYQWIKSKNGNVGSITYQSCPSAIDGNFLKPTTDSALALDLAYVGSTSIKPISIGPNVEFVFFSLSKSFGIRNIRTGWLFTRTPDSKLDKLTHSAKYYNYYANDVAEAIISQFDIDYVFNRLHSQQLEVCNKLDFVPSDSVWLATTKNLTYRKFFKGDIARICLSKVYNYDLQKI